MKTKILCACLIPVLFSMSVSAQDWSQFRGPDGISAVDSQVPIVFDEDTNMAWKSELPGRGVSGPIVVGEKVFVTASGGSKQNQLYTVCIDKESGKQLWSQELLATGRCHCHPTSANAAPTPASDGEYVYSFFSSNDLACYDLDGNLVWFRGLAVDRPKAGNDTGMSSSPVVADGVVVVQVEGPADAFVIGLDTKTGKTIWEAERKKNPSWSSPLLISAEGKQTMVLLQSQNYFSVLNLKTGKTVFENEGRVSTIASAAVSDGRLYVPVDGTTAFSISADGEFEKVWTGSRVTTSTSSGVVFQDQIFTLGRGGVLKSFKLADGEPVGSLRVGGNYWATPAVAGTHMYFFSQEGTARVVNLEKMEVVHEHEFKDEAFLGSPAISGNAMFVRSDRFLYKIAESDDAS